MYQDYLSLALLSVAVCVLSIIIQIYQPFQKPQRQPATLSTREISMTAEALAEALSESTFFEPHNVFSEFLKSYWALQERDLVPLCIVKPRSVAEVSTAVKILKRFFDAQQDDSKEIRFAIRSGGHSPIAGAANEHGGIVLDLSLLNQVSVSDDGSSVVMGTGATWGDVSGVLDQRGFAVAGGRASAVGVGGLTLGGGLSFFSSQVGFVCNNILSYKIVIADGSIITASETSHSDLWRALKGGGNNFGIVAEFTARCFPSSQIWSGFLYMMPSKANLVIDEVYEFTKNGQHEHTAGPLACFSYVQAIGIQVISVHLVHTKPEKWPTCWQGFKSIRRLWSTTKVQSLTKATEEVNASSPPGLRQLFCTTTVKNDLETLRETHVAHKRGTELLRKVKGLVWTLVLQPLHIAEQRQPDVMGLEPGGPPLIIVLFTAVWKRGSDDALVQDTARGIIAEIDAEAASRGTAHRYRYMNDCANWQRPFDGYGDKGKALLQGASRRYDPDGLFQRGCRGGFKLDV